MFTEGAMIRFLLFACATSLALNPVRADDTVRTCASFKAYQEYSLPRWEKGLIQSLRFPVSAVAEGALRDVAAIKLAQPDLTSTRLYDTICELADAGSTPAIRYKATLVRLVFDFPQVFEEEQGREYRNDQEIFTAIADRLQRTTLVMVR
jgi:hypothetical protein